MNKSIGLFFVFALLSISSVPDKHRGLGIPRYKGCPSNALCSQNTGQLRHQWKQLLIQNRNHPKKTKHLELFRRQKGIPLEVWTQASQGPTLGVHFDSPCSNWMQSEIFAPHFKKFDGGDYSTGLFAEK